MLTELVDKIVIENVTMHSDLFRYSSQMLTLLRDICQHSVFLTLDWKAPLFAFKNCGWC